MPGAYVPLANVSGFPAGIVPVTRVRAGEESDRPRKPRPGRSGGARNRARQRRPADRGAGDRAALARPRRTRRHGDDRSRRAKTARLSGAAAVMNDIRPQAAEHARHFRCAARGIFCAPERRRCRSVARIWSDSPTRSAATSSRLAAAISADFGNRSRHETELGEIFPVQSAIRHTLRHLARLDAAKAGIGRLRADARQRPHPLSAGRRGRDHQSVELSVQSRDRAAGRGARRRQPRDVEAVGADAAHVGFSGRASRPACFRPTRSRPSSAEPEAGQAFARLPFDHLLYTGSTAVGRMVMQAAAENLTPVTLELGGKSPCILGEDAALPSAAESIVYGKLLNAGQTCIAPDYVLLPEHRLDEFVELAVETAQKFYPTLAGNPDYTSIVNERHYRRVAQYVAEAKAKRRARRSRSIRRHEALPAEARKMPPTLVIEPGENLAVMREEIFGPVLPIKTYRGLDQAIDYVNSHPRPLALYYFGADAGKRDEVLRKTISGGASVNTTLFHFAAENLPFGGIGAVRHRRLSRRIWLPDLLAPQGRIPAEPPQWRAFSLSAVRAPHRSDAEISQARVTAAALTAVARSRTRSPAERAQVENILQLNIAIIKRHDAFSPFRDASQKAEHERGNYIHRKARLWSDEQRRLAAEIAQRVETEKLRFVRLAWGDTHGYSRAKALTAPAFLSALTNGYNIGVATTTLDSAGARVFCFVHARRRHGARRDDGLAQSHHRGRSVDLSHVAVGARRRLDPRRRIFQRRAAVSFLAASTSAQGARPAEGARLCQHHRPGDRVVSAARRRHAPERRQYRQSRRPRPPDRDLAGRARVPLPL